MALLQYTKKHDTAYDPVLPYPQAPGFEIKACEITALYSNKWMLINTGLTVLISPGYYGRISSRIAPNSRFILASPAIIPGGKVMSLSISAMYKGLIEEEVYFVSKGETVAVLTIHPQVSLKSLQCDGVASFCLKSFLPAIKVWKMHTDALFSENSLGLYLHADFPYEFQANEQLVVSTGVAIEFPEGYHGRVQNVHHCQIVNHLHVATTMLNSDKKEVKIVMYNPTSDVVKLCRKERICLVVLQENIKMQIVSVNDLPEAVPKLLTAKQLKPFFSKGVVLKVIINCHPEVPDNQVIESVQGSVVDFFKNVLTPNGAYYFNILKELCDLSFVLYVFVAGDKVEKRSYAEDLERHVISFCSDSGQRCFVKVLGL